MAAPILLYLLKANAVLLLFAAAYFGLLRRLTFFTLNRFYLLFALLFAAVYPALPMPALLPAEAMPAVAFRVVEATGSLAAPAVPVGPAVDWAAVALGLYAAGAAVLLARLLVQLLSLGRLRRQSRPALVSGLPVRVLAGAVSPFSFGRTIYLNPAQHPAPELAAVLRHEQVHVRQGHTLDVLLAQLALAAAWCNPSAWLLARALLDNLEYLADHAVLATGLDRRAYQYSLLRLSHGVGGPSLVSHFTFPTLKNRVAMMNTPLSSTGQLARYFVAGPLVLALALGLAGARAQGAGPIVPPAAARVQAAPAAAAKAITVRPQTSAAAHPLPASIQAYIAKKYPVSTISGYLVADHPAPKAPHIQYYASITTSGGEKHKLYFNSAEELVAAPAATAPALGKGISKPVPVVYLDGQRYTGDINNIGPKNIANISVFKGDKARQRFGAEAVDGAIVVTTIAKQNDGDVRAFNERVDGNTLQPAAPVAVSAPAVAPAPAANSVPYLAAPALAYITKNYPDARLVEMTEVRATDGSASTYKALLAIGRRPLSLLFDAQGKFISEVPSNH